MKILYICGVVLIVSGCAHQNKKTVQRPEIKNAIRNSMRGFKACYNVERSKDKKLSGTVTLAWEIHKGGVVKKVTVVDPETSLKNRVVQQCMMSEMALLVFSKPSGGLKIENAQHTFSFPDGGAQTKRAVSGK